MEESTKKLIAYLNVLGVKIDKNIFASRIKAQKIAYILQKLLDTNLYADFNFYIRGPYSRKLALEYFTNSDEFAAGKSSYQPTKSEAEELEKVKPMLSGLSVSELEIIASLLYLRMEIYLDEEAAEKMLRERKPHLRFEDIWRGTNAIKKLFLSDQHREKIMKSLKEEMQDWDELSNKSLNRFGQ